MQLICLVMQWRRMGSDMNDWDVMQSGYKHEQIYPDFLSDFTFELMIKPLFSKRFEHEKIKFEAPDGAQFYDEHGDYFFDDIVGRFKYRKITRSWSLIPECDFWGKLTPL